jgi:signal peptidase I
MLAPMSDEQRPAQQPTTKKPWLAPVLIAVALLGVASVVAVLALRFTFFMPFRVPSGSMWPGIAVGDHVLANGTDTVPARGAVLIFKYPEQPRQLFIKRVVGLSGDVIMVKNKRLFVNGWEVPHCTVGKASYVDTDPTVKHNGELEVEFLDDASYLVFHDPSSFGAVEEQGPFKVKPGEYFVMGDNRENAHDSRMWNGGAGGGVPLQNTTGRLRVDAASPALPKGAEDLRDALGRCLATRPQKTSPPPSPP